MSPDFMTLGYSTIDPVLSASLVIAAVFINHKSCTPPNLPPKHPKVLPELGWRQRKYTALVSPISQFLIWLVGTTEVAGILLGKDTIEPMHANAWLIIGTSLIISGGILRFACFRSLGKLFVFQVSIRKDHELITEGAYGVVRHPSYSGTLMTLFGIVIWQGGSPFSCTRKVLEDAFGLGNLGRVLVVCGVIWCLAVPWLILERSHTEDEILRNEFGDQWTRWAEKVPYALVPHVI